MPAASSNQNAIEHVQWQSFLDVENDVKTWLQVPATDTSHDSTLGLLTDMACQWVQRYLGQPVAATTFEYLFDGWTGWQGAYIMLPYYPVLEVELVTEWWGASGGHALTEQTPTDQVTGWQCEYRTGRLTRVFPGLIQRPWFPGSRNIKVRWTAGRNPIPADIRVAALEFIAHWYRNTQQQSGLRPSGLTDADEYDPASSGLWAGVPFRIMDLLEPFTQQGMG